MNCCVPEHSYDYGLDGCVAGGATGGGNALGGFRETSQQWAMTHGRGKCRGPPLGSGTLS